MRAAVLLVPWGLCLATLVGCFSRAPAVSPWPPEEVVAGRPVRYAPGAIDPALVCANPDATSSCFVEIPGGTFLMGAQAADPAAPGYDPHAEPEEGPPHEVTVTGFWLQRSEVGATEFAVCVEAGGCDAEDASTGGYSTYGAAERTSLPINGVTWAGAQRYCHWLGGRLPTEAEWELAARGTDGRWFPWGNLARCGRFDPAASREAPDGAEEITCLNAGPVGAGALRGASPYGVTGMAGNVWEWVADWYGPYTAAAAVDPAGPRTGERRVQRGGGWANERAWELRSTARGSLVPDEHFNDVGFRCMRPR